MFSLVTFIPRAIVQSIPLLLGCVGETLNEKSGSLNLGIPGVMYVGAICGVIGSFMYENSGAAFNPVIGLLIPIICCMLGSLLMGLIFCFLTVTLRANQNVTGLAMTTFGVGFGNFFGGSIIKLTGAEVPSIALSATSKAFKATIPFADKAGVVGDLLLSYSFMTYVAIAIAIITSYVLKRTRTSEEDTHRTRTQSRRREPCYSRCRGYKYQQIQILLDLHRVHDRRDRRTLLRT